MIIYSIWCFCSFIFFIPMSQIIICHKQKWHVLFFMCVKLMVHVLMHVHAIACIKWVRLTNLWTLFLKTEKFSIFYNEDLSCSFQLRSMKKKKNFWKKLCFVFRKRMLCIFQVKYNKRLIGFKLKRHLGFSFSKTL